jgi:hypothetical protein
MLLASRTGHSLDGELRGPDVGLAYGITWNFGLGIENICVIGKGKYNNDKYCNPS